MSLYILPTRVLLHFHLIIKSKLKANNITNNKLCGCGALTCEYDTASQTGQASVCSWRPAPLYRWSLSASWPECSRAPASSLKPNSKDIMIF